MPTSTVGCRLPRRHDHLRFRPIDSRQNDRFLFFRAPAQAFYKVITLKHLGWAPTDLTCLRLYYCSSSPAGVHPNAEKVPALTNMSTPGDLEQLSFLFIWLLGFLQASAG